MSCSFKKPGSVANHLPTFEHPNIFDYAVYQTHDFYTSEFPHEQHQRGLGSNGVAILVRQSLFQQTPTGLFESFPGWDIADMEGRYIELHFGELVLISAYFLNASRNNDHRLNYKYAFQTAFETRVTQLQKDGFSVVVGADFNVAGTHLDIHCDVVPMISSGFRPPERDWFNNLSHLFIDSFRYCNPFRAGDYTTWFYHNRRGNMGMRYDGIFSSFNIVPRTSQHDHSIDGSDHIPVVSTF
ncbi:Endonuclease/exonuclease/phosphatase, partial [Obelidium mucronatum]